MGLMVLFASVNMSVAGALAEGKKSYQQYCANCHGDRGKGLSHRMPDFTRSQGLLTTDRKLVDHVETGKGLCPSYQTIIPRNNIFSIIRYIRTLR